MAARRRSGDPVPQRHHDRRDPQGHRAARPHRSGRAAGLDDWLDTLRRIYTDRILAIDDAVAVTSGRLMAQRTRPTVDTLIAATARVHSLVLVTRNVTDFADTGVDVINPWAA